MNKLICSLFLLSNLINSHAENNTACQNPKIKIADLRELVYSYKHNQCSKLDVPDTPALMDFLVAIWF
ncbi:hypothetical protein [Legionella fallonii]|uniref:Uncharacterized protein n=1 Tax=Legionella fallonii LLAP-10 TaxID=1212491 RepID=A0A098G2F2_9GAMM|nr:hypothetical protein [Legionella fallonii]CEG56161.1 exported protein of unknown function [Legionella fallonii LLAP-10]